LNNKREAFRNGCFEFYLGEASVGERRGGGWSGSFALPLPSVRYPAMPAGAPANKLAPKLIPRSIVTLTFDPRLKRSLPKLKRTNKSFENGFIFVSRMIRTGVMPIIKIP